MVAERSGVVGLAEAWRAKEGDLERMRRRAERPTVKTCSRKETYRMAPDPHDHMSERRSAGGSKGNAHEELLIAGRSESQATMLYWRAGER